jgi:hypothetical protein
VVQPAHCADVPRHGRQRLPLPRLRRPAGLWISACVASRSNDGRITFHDWHPVGIEEYGYAAPDPLDPDIVYGGKVTGTTAAPARSRTWSRKPAAHLSALRTEPLQFSPVDPHKPLLRHQLSLADQNGGKNWKEISPT